MSNTEITSEQESRETGNLIIGLIFGLLVVPIVVLISCCIILRYKEKLKRLDACPRCDAQLFSQEAARRIITERIRRDGEERYPELVELAERIERMEQSSAVEHVELADLPGPRQSLPQ